MTKEIVRPERISKEDPTAHHVFDQTTVVSPNPKRTFWVVIGDLGMPHSGLELAIDQLLYHVNDVVKADEVRVENEDCLALSFGDIDHFNHARSFLQSLCDDPFTLATGHACHVQLGQDLAHPFHGLNRVRVNAL